MTYQDPSYPPGATHDLNAPWNQKDNGLCLKCGTEISEGEEFCSDICREEYMEIVHDVESEIKEKNNE